MAKLVAKGADAVDRGAQVAVALQLVEHGIPVDGHAIELKRARDAASPVIGLLHVPLAGPHALGDGAIGLGLAHAGIEHDHDIDHAVAVVVIAREIHVGQRAARIIDHRSQALVHFLAIDALVAAIVGAVVRQRHGAQDVELGGELPV